MAGGTVSRPRRGRSPGGAGGGGGGGGEQGAEPALPAEQDAVGVVEVAGAAERGAHHVDQVVAVDLPIDVLKAGEQLQGH